MLPNFLFIGPDKAGSKWLHDIFLRHPECFVPGIADPYFFDRHYDLGLPWYERLFADAPASARALGELSHDYLFSDDAADRIRRDLPGVRLLVCLREPVDRSFSQYLSMVRAGMTRDPFDVAWRTIPALKGNSQYGVHLRRYFDRFPREQVKVVFYDQLVSAPRAFARAIFDFLGISFPDGLPYDQRVNPAGKPRSVWLARAAQAGAHWARTWGLAPLVGALKRSFVRGVLYRPYASGERPRLSEEARAVLRREFDGDLSAVERELGVDLGAWRRGLSLYPVAGTSALR